jgi:hypothetical protein
MLFVPVLLSNILPALVIRLIAFAYLEGLLLCLTLLAALVLNSVASGAVWKSQGVVTGIRF